MSSRLVLTLFHPLSYYPVNDALTCAAVLLFVLWYCHKRGKEERLKKEEAAKEGLANEGPTVEEPSDDEVVGGPSAPPRLGAPDPVLPITGPDDAGEGSSHQGATGSTGTTEAGRAK